MAVRVKLVGTNGNAFALIAKVSDALRRAGEHDVRAQFLIDVEECESYDALLQLIMRTVEVE